MVKSSPPYALRRREALRPGLIRILGTMGRTARTLPELPESDLGESIHGLRILIKRLRAYLWFIRPALGKKLYAKSNVMLRESAQRLSQARDLHAVASALTKAASKADANQLLALAHVSQAFARHSTATQKSDQNVRELEDVADTIIQTISKIVRITQGNSKQWPSPERRIEKSFARARKAMKKSSRKKDSRLVHEWRKKTKRLFYILQLTAQLPQAGKPDCLKKIDELQEMLGNFQDNVVASKHLRRQPPDIDAAHIEAAQHLLRKNRKALLKQAHLCGNAVLHDF